MSRRGKGHESAYYSCKCTWVQFWSQGSDRNENMVCCRHAYAKSSLKWIQFRFYRVLNLKANNLIHVDPVCEHKILWIWNLNYSLCVHQLKHPFFISQTLYLWHSFTVSSLLSIFFAKHLLWATHLRSSPQLPYAINLFIFRATII